MAAGGRFEVSAQDKLADFCAVEFHFDGQAQAEGCFLEEGLLPIGPGGQKEFEVAVWAESGLDVRAEGVLAASAGGGGEDAATARLEKGVQVDQLRLVWCSVHVTLIRQECEERNGMNFGLGEEFRAALAEHRPVVALESTLITHGLPQPVNLHAAQTLEQIVRDHGATPATIALLDGHVHIGLNADELKRLAQAKNVRKCSRRDLPIAVARGEHGATTVAATMYLAHAAGIRVFATGGIGGVHRGQPFDVSADLEELGRTPVTVVCAGAKAILDLPLTLEALETRGVCVVGYGCDEFPAFYSRSSGLPVDVRCDVPEDVAALMKARDELGLSAGLLVCAPIPPEHEVPSSEMEIVIAAALSEAETGGIRGKEVTPFLLARVSALTEQRSQRANLALLENNARIAARIAGAVSPRV